MPTIDELEVGQAATLEHTVTDEDIQKFAEVSGDNNPVHLDEAYAAETMFEGRIAHGMLSAAYISAVLGTRLPGPGAIYVSQSLKFKAPVRIGDTVSTRVEVREINAKRRRAWLDTTCSVGETVVLEGEAEVMLPRA